MTQIETNEIKAKLNLFAPNVKTLKRIGLKQIETSDFQTTVHTFDIKGQTFAIVRYHGVRGENRRAVVQCSNDTAWRF